MDTDYHSVTDLQGKILNPNDEIIFGDDVWVGCRSTILKGTSIGNMCVIAASSLVKGHFRVNNVLIGGHPSKILRHEIAWYR